MTQVYVELLPINLIKGKYDGKSDKYFVKIILHRDLMSSTSELYEFNTSLFVNRNPEEFLWFMRNFNTTLAASRIPDMGARVQCLCTLLHGYVLRQFDLLSVDVESTEPLTVEYIIKGLELYPPPL